MHRFFVALVVALSLSACAERPPAQTPHTSGAYDLERKTVALVMTNGVEARAFCSGVWIGENLILTANHCVDDADPGDSVSYVVRNDVVASDGDEIAAVRVAHVKAQDPAHDVALLTAKMPPAHGVAAFAKRPAAVGDVVQSMGHPRGLLWSYSTGNVAALRTDDTGMWFVQSTAPISPGNSGGGLFDEWGDLVGVCHSYIPSGENLNLYVDARYARELLKAQAEP